MIILTYRLSIFGDFKQFSPTTSNTVRWTQMLQTSGYELLPNIIQNQPPQPFIVLQSPNVDNRIQFVSQDGNIALRLLSDRIDVELSPGDIENFEETIKEKLEYAIPLLALMYNSLGDIKGNRLAYYVDALIREPDGGAFQDFYKRNNLTLELGIPENKCVEWVHRFNRRISIEVGTGAEESNAIFALEATALQGINVDDGRVSAMPGLHIVADINTLAENSNLRFCIADLEKYCHTAQEVYINLVKQIKGQLCI